MNFRPLARAFAGALNPRDVVGHKAGVIRRLLFGLVLSGIPLRADMLWDFQEVDTRPSTIGGIYAYVYPSATDPKSHRTDAHSATLARVVSGPGSTEGRPGARLDFVLDGDRFPSAGFGLMFPESQPLDLRELKSLHVRLKASTPRKVRVSLSSHLPAYEAATDTGVSLGAEILVGPEGVDWDVAASRLTWPKWVVEVPAVSEDAVFASTFAVQLNVSCQTTDGVCAQDSGWLVVDSLRLTGVGGGYPAPEPGRGCFGDSIEVSRFSSETPKKNGFSGWWYAFSDVSASDSSRGESRILSASDTAKPTSWRPDSIGNRAWLDFRLQRVGPYSGFVGLETQFGPPDAKGLPVSVSISDLVAVGFDLEYGDFPTDLGGISFHVKKTGRYFQNGAEHQVRIPYDSVPRRWCLDLKDLRQPPWSPWQLAFSPEDLLTMSWEVKLQGVASSARGAFGIRNLRVYRNGGVGVDPSVRRRSVQAGRSAGGVWVERALAQGTASLVVVDLQGRILARQSFAPGQRRAEIAGIPSGLVWLRYQDGRGGQTLPVGY